MGETDKKRCGQIEEINYRKLVVRKNAIRL